MSEEFLCVRCSRVQLTCCQSCEIHPTAGDTERIAEHTGLTDFTEYRYPDDPVYLQHDDDPVWLAHVFRPDMTRRVLKRKENGDCMFLGNAGCVLPLEVRPLVCRIYPFQYNHTGLTGGLSDGCPTQLLQIGQTLLEALDMNQTDAERWHKQLYEEIVSGDPG
ncbi:protein of unknown function UPF0153 [Pirellula staleyi DSM 6068]|uniref:YkgJ family cysteine cluster protein n=1 Tax=Pirellula staleyi (strain ATCC 27377 / DSM 6068 / ICPB 4128) TaxID=530564 RepID=D2QXW5_PIRSD|nr:YkgJ family cysteine cluster protein [Pirellula staleyi]ADB18042.1 protein of unknown function UPF0153 [Pirellula staleyi DSM 6068]